MGGVGSSSRLCLFSGPRAHGPRWRGPSRTSTPTTRRTGPSGSATTTMLLRQRDGLIGECPASKAKESQALEAKLVGPAQQCRTVIESALRSYAQDTSQLLTKFRDQQKKKEKLPEQAVSILNAWLHEHLCAAPQPFPPQMTTRAVAATTPTPPRPRRTSWLRRRGWR